MQAAEQADAPGALLDRDVPAGLGHALLQGEDIPGIEQIRVECRHRRVGPVQGEAEDRLASEGGRRVGGDDVDALRPGGEVVGEEPEHGQGAGRGDAVREQERAVIRARGNGLRQGEAIGDVDAEVVDRGGERATVSTTSPTVVLRDVSGRSGAPPWLAATANVEGTVALSVSSSWAFSSVCTLIAFCWPGVGARNPVLTPPRTETAPLSP